jgi:tetratricopeptide (TPR) repeat protein
MVRALALLTLSALCAPAAEQWTRLQTPHFELYTTAGEKKGRELILYFEQVRSFFIQASPVKGVADFPARIVVFRSEKQYKPYAPNEAAAAFYTPGRYRDYIVLGDTEPDHLPVAIHEYTHLIVEHSHLKLPVWLNEGWADLYSTLKPNGRKAMVGDLIPGRVQVLMNQKWMSFDELTSVGLKSATYNEKDRAGIFYAESWALVHMLYLAPEYSPKFSNFVAAVNKGKSAAEACQIAYGRTSAQMFADLQAYLRRNQLFGAVFDVKLSKSEEEAEASQPPAYESETVLADLLSITNKKDQAAAAYRKLEAENPGKPEIPQSMAYLAWQNNDRDTARREFEKAFAAGGNDPEMCYHMAMLELEKDSRSETAIKALNRAIQVKPDYTDARLQLGLAQLNAGDFAAGVSALEQIHKINDEQAATLFNAMAYGYSRIGNVDEARKQAQAALKWDKTDAERERTENILSYLDSRGKPALAGLASEIDDNRPHLTRPAETDDATPPPPKNPFVKPGEKIERIEGTAKALDCEGKRFLIEAGGKTIAFDMRDPGRVLLKHKDSITVDFMCGPQKAFPVVVEYAPGEKIGKDVVGSLRSLEF